MDKIKKIINRETILYVVFGVGTTVINWILLLVLHEKTTLSVAMSNTIGWFFAVTFSYIVNRIFVFKSNMRYLPGLLREIVLYYLSRVFSLLVENAGLKIFCEKMYIHVGIAKLLTSVIVIILNYILCKLIFKNKGEKIHAEEN